jgi:ParB family chromosome partitioning protein
MPDNAAFKSIPLAQLHESPLNPRRHFGEKALQELAESVRTHGVLTPLLVRPNSSGYEIAAGHRRFRAARIAGLEEVPAIIREMTDQQFVEAVTIENLQREDVHPIEEAAGYQRLIDDYGYTKEMLAERVGRSESYIAKRLALAGLIDAAKAPFLEGRINIGHAILLARLQPDDQETAVKDALFEGGESWENGKWVKRNPVAVSVSALDAWIRENVYLDLSTAAWRKDDATLLAGAGPCISCPKRSGANGLLFDDLKKGDICLDAECFHQKRDNHLIQVQAAAEKAGTPLVRIAREYVSNAKELKVLSSSGDYHLISNKNDRCEHIEKAVIAVGPREVGKVVDICRTKACKKHGTYIYHRGSTGGGAKTFAEIWADRKKKLEEKIALEVKRELWRQVVHDVPEEFNRFEMELVGRKLIDRAGHDGRNALCAALALEGEKGEFSTDYEAPLVAHMENLADKDLPGFLVGVALYGALAFRDDDLNSLAKEYRIDVKAVENTVAEPFRADFEKRKAKAKAGHDKAQKAAKKAARPGRETKAASRETKRSKSRTRTAAAGTKPAAGETSARAGKVVKAETCKLLQGKRVWPTPNERGAYDPKDCAIIYCPEKDFSARILLVETKDGWHGTFEAALPHSVKYGLPSRYDPTFSTRSEALCGVGESMLAWLERDRGHVRPKNHIEQAARFEDWAKKLQAEAREKPADEAEAGETWAPPQKPDQVIEFFGPGKRKPHALPLADIQVRSIKGGYFVSVGVSLPTKEAEGYGVSGPLMLSGDVGAAEMTDPLAIWSDRDAAIIAAYRWIWKFATKAENYSGKTPRMIAAARQVRDWADERFDALGVAPVPDDPGVRRCRVCGCSDDDCRGCIERTGKPCHWVAQDLCSACVGKELRQ